MNSGNHAGAERRTRDWPEIRSQEIVPRIVFNDGWLQNEFKEVSWSAWMQPLGETRNKGMLQGPGMCASVQGGVGFPKPSMQNWSICTVSKHTCLMCLGPITLVLIGFGWRCAFSISMPTASKKEQARRSFVNYLKVSPSNRIVDLPLGCPFVGSICAQVMEWHL